MQETSDSLVINLLLIFQLGLTSKILIASQQPATQTTITGIILTITSVVLGITGSILNGWYGTQTSALTRTAAANLIGMLATIPILIINLNTPEATHPTWTTIIAAITVAILAGTVAKTLNLYALKTIPIPAVLQASTLSLITAVITAWLILGQQPNTITWVGVAFGIAATFTLAYIIKLNSNKPAS